MLLDFVHFVLLVLGIGTAIVLVIGGIAFAWDEAEAYVDKKERQAATRERQSADEDWKSTMRHLGTAFDSIDPHLAETFRRMSRGIWHHSDIVTAYEKDKAASMPGQAQVKRRPRKAAR